MYDRIPCSEVKKNSFKFSAIAYEISDADQTNSLMKTRVVNYIQHPIIFIVSIFVLFYFPTHMPAILVLTRFNYLRKRG